MITREKLIAAGYKHFNQSHIKEYTDSFLQKRFDDEYGKRYFITIVEYNHGVDKLYYIPFTEFESHGTTFDIEMYNPGSVEQMEKFFENIWFKMDCNYYEEF